LASPLVGHGPHDEVDSGDFGGLWVEVYAVEMILQNEAQVLDVNGRFPFLLR